jgi:hypothetical protein
MKLKFLYIALFAVLFSCSSSKPVAQEQKGNFIVGKTTWSEWLEKTKWDIVPTYEFYFPDKKKIQKISELMEGKNYSFVVFATTSCEECKEYVPRAFKIFHELGIDDDRISLYGLDENLEEPSKEYLKYDIPTTPCVFIKYDDNIIAEVSYPFLWLESFLEVFESQK